MEGHGDSADIWLTCYSTGDRRSITAKHLQHLLSLREKETPDLNDDGKEAVSQYNRRQGPRISLRMETDCFNGRNPTAIALGDNDRGTDQASGCTT